VAIRSTPGRSLVTSRALADIDLADIDLADSGTDVA